MLISETGPPSYELTSETGSGGVGEEETSVQPAPPLHPIEQTARASEAVATSEARPQFKGRRTQLRIVRESVQSLSRDVGSFRKSHEAGAKALEAQVASLRKEFAAYTRSMDFGNFVKSHESSTKRLEKQVAALRNELAALKSDIAKEAARGRATQEATLTRILAKVSAKSSKPAKRSKKR